MIEDITFPWNTVILKSIIIEKFLLPGIWETFVLPLVYLMQEEFINISQNVKVWKEIENRVCYGFGYVVLRQISLRILF